MLFFKLRPLFIEILLRFDWGLIESSEGRGPTNPQPTPYQPPIIPLSTKNELRPRYWEKKRGFEHKKPEKVCDSKEWEVKEWEMKKGIVLVGLNI